MDVTKERKTDLCLESWNKRTLESWRKVEFLENEFGKCVHGFAFVGRVVVTALNMRIRSRGM